MSKKKWTVEDAKKAQEERLKETAELFVKAIQENKAPWQKKWNPAIDKSNFNMFTMGEKSNKVYKGWNAIHLEIVKDMRLRTDDPRWFTFAELIKYNENLKDPNNRVNIKKGEKMTEIKFYEFQYYDKNGKKIDTSKYTAEELKNMDKTSKPFLTHYFIANASQTEKYLFDNNGNKILDENGNQKKGPGFPYKITKEEIERAEREFKPKYKIEEIIKNTKAVIKEDNNDSCFFDPATNEIHMVQKERFDDAQTYYQTLAHELIHWAGDKRRLDREEARLYGTNKKMHAKEELIAEIGCYLLCREAEFMFKPSDRNNAYVQSWCRDILDKPETIEDCCRKAQKAVNYVMDFTNSRSKANDKEKEVEIVISKEETENTTKSKTR